MILKSGAVTFPIYWQDNWNMMDFLIVAGSMYGVVLFFYSSDSSGLSVNIIRIVRVARLLKLAKGIKSLQQLISTIMLTIPAIGNLTLLLCLFLYIFTAVGVSMFAKTAYYEN
jgi:hypothetical protein